ncbi:DUF3291 domain-containing protein [Gammaproteobacteria bacterium]|nr:DUF3291 domain-containing protein [Gammaproteobacteria bacterium]
MTTTTWHIAQLNIAQMSAPLDSPQLAGFVGNLDRINALADASPGFVWRLVDESGGSTDAHVFADDLVVNLSVWSDVDSLNDFVYKTAHAEIMARRREWFERMTQPWHVLWWVPSEHRPDALEARERLDQLRQYGPSPAAFTFKQRFDAPGAS